MTAGREIPDTTRLRSLVTVVVASAVFVLVVCTLDFAAKSLFAGTVTASLRARATVELSGAMVGEILALVLLVLFLRWRGVSLRQLGLWARSPVRGWVAAAVVAALFIAFNLALPLRGHGHLGEVSLFHIYNSVTAGVVAGFVEEIFFRGFFMTELAWAGFGKTAQVLISAILYGLVHSAWGLASGMFTLQLVGGAVIGTAVFGLFCAGVYLLSRRSLMPIIAGHAAIDFVIEPWLFLVALSMFAPH